MLSSQIILGELAAFRGSQVQSVTRLIKNDSPALTEWDTLHEIKRILKKISIQELITQEEVGDKSLQHE